MIYRFLKRQKWISVLITSIFFLQTMGGLAIAAPQTQDNSKKGFKTVNLVQRKSVNLANFIAPKLKNFKLTNNQSNYVPGEVLVKYKPKTSTLAQSKSVSAAGVEKTLQKLGPTGKEINRYKLQNGQSVEDAVSKLKKDPNVLYAEPNYIRKSKLIPNDTYFGEQWGLNNTGQSLNTAPTITPGGTPGADIDAPEAWDMETGTAPVTVAVIDSGIDASHPDLAGKIAGGYNFAGISQYSINGAFTMGPSFNPVAQSIKGTGQALTDIEVVLAKTGTPTENVTVSVRDSLSGPDLASYTITSAEIAVSPTQIKKTLSAPVTLTNGTTYYIVVSTTNTTGAYDIYADQNDPTNPNPSLQEPDKYVDGMFQSCASGVWTSQPRYDMYFKTNANTNPRDDNGHGTHVSGIIAANSNNGLGVSGVDPGALIMPLKAGDSSGSFTSADIIAAINYASTHGAQVINMSLGGTTPSTAEQDAITAAYNSGVVIFASAGNDGNGTINYPASYTNVIGVGATDRFDNRASFSNYNSSVDVTAPGDIVLSTMPTYSTEIVPNYTAGAEYIYMSGTSMASPMAAGLAALMKSADASLTPAQIESIMEQNSDDLGAIGRDDQFGYGRINAQKAITYIKDTTPPTGSVNINGGATLTNNPNVSLAIAATDPAPSTGLKDMWISNDGTTGTWETYATTKSWPLSTGDGSKTVTVKFRDVKGNVSSPATANITLDTTAPTGGSVSINSGAASTNTTAVTLTIAATGADQMMIGNDSAFTGGVWETYATTKSWNLLTGDGTKIVYVKFKDNAGNESVVSTNTILLDTPQPPTGSVTINGGASYTNSSAVTLNIAASADATQMWISNDPLFGTGNWETYATTKSWNLSSIDGTKRVYVKLKDAGNNEATYSNTIVLDIVAPTVSSVTINGGAASTASTAVTLNLTASDATSGIASMMISNDASFTGAGWESYAISKNWTLTSGNGTKTVYIKFKDNAGNVTASYSPSIVLNVPAPPAPPAPASTPGPSYPGSYVQNGANGQAVSSIQDKLNSLGFNSGAVDGKFGPKTLAAIKAFQRANGLVPDGIVGPLTWAKLFGNGSIPAGNYTRPITYGIIDSSVASIQSKLAVLGFNPGTVDGIFGPRTLSAIKAFQRSRGLAADGIVGPITWRALFG